MLLDALLKQYSPSARPSPLLALLIPALHPLARADGPVGLPEHITLLIVLPILLGTLVVLIVPRVAVPSLVGAWEADIKRCRLHLDLGWGWLLLLFFFPLPLFLFRLYMHKAHDDCCPDQCFFEQPWRP